MTTALPNRAAAVVIGGGIIGLSTAYHLCRRGMTDVVVLERQQIASGTTWHAAGLIGSVRSSEILHRQIHRIYDFIRDVEEESGQETGFRRVGSLWIAHDQERWAEIRRLHDQTRLWGPETRLLTPNEVGDLFPLMDTQGLVGGMHAPSEGWISPVDFCQAVFKAASHRGALVVEGCEITGIDVEHGRITGVRCGEQRIETSLVANCAGLWGRKVGHLAGTDVPLQAVEHYYAITEKSDDIPRDLPVLRDQSSCAYIKEDAGSILVGAFEREARPVALESLPEDFAFGEIEGDFDGQFLPVLEAVMERLPILKTLGIRKFFCGPESFTPDGQVQLGASDDVNGMFVCAGCNSQGIQSAAGYGGLLADWMVDGHAPCDLSHIDLLRNEPFMNGPSYVWRRSVETLGLLYDHHFPYRQLASERGVRRSPLHDKLAAHGACFGEVAGYERANWFAPKGMEPAYRYSFASQNWHPHSAAEHMAFRDGVGLIDLSSFATFHVVGPGSCEVLQRICSADVDVPPGRIVYTHWLNSRGGIESDLTVTRLEETAYQITTGVAVQRRDWAWLFSNLDTSDQITVVDSSSADAIIGVFGPRSRALLEEVAGLTLDSASCPYGSCLEVTVGAAPTKLMRTCFAGGLGWEVHVLSEFAGHAFETLMDFGAGHGLRLCGMHALDSCRIERGFVHYGHEVSPDENPFQVGLGFVCNFNKGEFIGRDAALRHREAGLESQTSRLASILLQDPGPLLYGGEPILRNGDPVGYVTSGAFGHYLGASIGLGWLRNIDGVSADWVNSGDYTLLVESNAVEANVSLKPFFDGKQARS